MYNRLQIEIQLKIKEAELELLKKELDAIEKDAIEIKIKGDTSELESTTKKIDSLKSNIQKTTKEQEILKQGMKAPMSKFEIWEWGENVSAVFTRVKDLAISVGHTIKENITKAAQTQVLRENFKGTAQDIELFKKAVAGTVSEAGLIKLSNQASDLGLSLKEQALLFSLAEDAADRYGSSTVEGFEKVLFATEGSSKGLKALGIQKAEYDKMVEKLTRQMGGEIESIQDETGARQILIKNLDAEEQKRIRVNAILALTGVTLDDVNQKQMDSADKIENLSVKFEEAKEKIGGLGLHVLQPLIDLFSSLDSGVAAFTITVIGLAGAIAVVLPALTALKASLIALNVETGGILLIIGAIVTAGFAVWQLASHIDETNISIDEMNSHIKKSKSNLSDINTVLETNEKQLVLNQQQTDEYNNALNRLKETYPGVFSGGVLNLQLLKEIAQQEKENIRLKNEAILVQQKQDVTNILKNQITKQEEYNKLQKKRAEILSDIEIWTKKLSNTEIEYEEALRKNEWTRYSLLTNLTGIKKEIELQNNLLDENTKKLALNSDGTEELSIKIREMLANAAKIGSLVNVYSFLSDATKNNVIQTNILKNAFFSLSDTAIQGLLGISGALKQNATLMNSFQSALLVIRAGIAAMSESMVRTGIAALQMVVSEAQKISLDIPDENKPLKTTAQSSDKTKIITDTFSEQLEKLKTKYEYQETFNTLTVESIALISQEAFSLKELADTTEKEITLQSFLNELKNKSNELIKEQKKYLDDILKRTQEQIQLEDTKKEAIKNIDTEISKLKADYEHALLPDDVKITADIAYKFDAMEKRLLSINYITNEQAAVIRNLIRQWKEYEFQLTEIESKKQKFESVFEVLKSGFSSFASSVSDSSKSMASAFKEAAKSMLQSFITLVQGKLTAAMADVFAKGVLTFGISVPVDLALMGTAWGFLEIAKGFIGQLQYGGPFTPGTYLVGEKGPELAVMGSSGYMFSNSDLKKLLNSYIPANINNPVSIFIDADADWLKVGINSQKALNKYNKLITV
ncbi:MAG: hypothetical protein FJ216_07385 [Ignavibacteria bacterium]|nr:hypothetical protein [Ignavibacteria bacterium]